MLHGLRRSAVALLLEAGERSEAAGKLGAGEEEKTLDSLALEDATTRTK